MLITKIERQKKRASRKSVFVDGSFAFGIGDDVLIKFALHEGAQLDKGTIEKILKTEQEETAKQKALRFLSIRPRSKKEMRDYLLRKEFSADIIDYVVGRLETLNMLDDLAFARMVCRDSLAKKPGGAKMLRQALFKKGVPKEIIETVLAEFSTPESEFAMAVKAAEHQSMRIARSSKRLDNDHFKKKILDYLVRRGFAYDTALNATKHLLSK
ncbi:MAG: RecX family transcriptional regulator [Bacteroidota bacterium]